MNDNFHLMPRVMALILRACRLLISSISIAAGYIFRCWHD